MINDLRPTSFSSCLWCDLRFNVRSHCSPGSENEFLDLETFSDDVVEVQKEFTKSVVAADAGGAAPHSSAPQDEASPEFARELEMTIQNSQNPVESFPLVETHEDLPEGQDPSPSIVAFNKSFGTSHRGELLSFGHEMAIAGDGASKFLVLWNSSKFRDASGEEASKQAPQLLSKTIRGSSLLLPRRKPPRPLNALARLLLRLLAKKVCELFFLLSSRLNFSCYFLFSLFLWYGLLLRTFRFRRNPMDISDLQA
jgi:hypothetical protein